MEDWDERATGLLATVALLVLLNGCAILPETHSQYRQELARSAHAAGSAVTTAMLVVEAVARGQAPEPYVSRTLSYAESDVQSTASAFSVIQPPDDAEAVRRARFITTLDKAETVLGRLRVAARRGHLEALPRLAGPLAGLRSQFRAWERTAPT